MSPAVLQAWRCGRSDYKLRYQRQRGERMVKVFLPALIMVLILTVRDDAFSSWMTRDIFAAQLYGQTAGFSESLLESQWAAKSALAEEVILALDEHCVRPFGGARAVNGKRVRIVGEEVRGLARIRVRCIDFEGTTCLC